MNFDLSEKLDTFLAVFESLSLLQGLLFAVFFLAVWFLPSILAIFLNRKHLGKIAAANVLAGLSWVAWFALLAWAATGKANFKKDGKSSVETSV